MFNAFPDREFSKEEITVIKNTIFLHYVEEIPLVSVIRRYRSQKKFRVLEIVIFRSEGNIPVAPFAVVKLLASICRIPSLYQILTININWKIQEQKDKILKCDTLDVREKRIHKFLFIYFSASSCSITVARLL